MIRSAGLLVYEEADFLWQKKSEFFVKKLWLNKGKHDIISKNYFRGTL